MRKWTLIHFAAFAVASAIVFTIAHFAGTNGFVLSALILWPLSQIIAGEIESRRSHK